MKDEHIHPSDVHIKDIGIDKTRYRAKSILPLLNISFYQLNKIVNRYHIPCEQDQRYYRSWKYYRAREVFEIAEIRRLELTGEYTVKGIKRKLQQLRDGRKHYTFRENGIKYRYGRKAGKHKKGIEELKREGILY